MARFSPVNRLSSPWAWAGAGALLGLIVILLWQAPARWLTGAVQYASQGRISFEQVRGTVWRGSGRVTLTGGAGSLEAATLPGRLRWQVRPTPTGVLADLEAECCTQAPWHLVLQARWKGARLVMADSLPKAFLMHWMLQRACEVQVATGAAGTPVAIPPEVIAVHQRDLSAVQLPVGPGVPDFEAMVRVIDRRDRSWRD